MDPVHAGLVGRGKGAGAGGGAASGRQLLFRYGRHGGRRAGAELMGWEGVVDGFL